MNRNKLTQMLFLTARSAQGVHDDATARTVRESACLYVTRWIGGDARAEGDYTKLSDEELNHVISFLKKGKSYLEKNVRKFSVQTGFATQAQKQKIWYLAIQCAIVYCDLEGFAMVSDGGDYVSGEDARVHFKELNDRRKLIGAWRDRLFKDWICPKCNALLQEGEFRYKVKEPKDWGVLMWNTVTLEEADYLIKRLDKMHNEIVQRYQKITNSPTVIAVYN